VRDRTAHARTVPTTTPPPVMCRWVVGPAELIRGLIVTNQWVQFSVSTPAQAAIAACLDVADGPYEGHASYFHWLRGQYARKRAILLQGLRAAGEGRCGRGGGRDACMWWCSAMVGGHGVHSGGVARRGG
jgi:DNA-binding transcriptional MocR family regulator